MYQNSSMGILGVLEYLLLVLLMAAVCLGIPIVAIVDLARTPDSSFRGGMARGGWIAIIAVLTVLTIVGGVVVALWWLLVARRRIALHRA